jgi:hypothetical protein
MVLDGVLAVAAGFEPRAAASTREDMWERLCNPASDAPVPVHAALRLFVSVGQSTTGRTGRPSRAAMTSLASAYSLPA